MDINRIIERMNIASNTTTGKQLAKYIGVSPQMISTWKSKGTIPYKECAVIARKSTYSMDWLLTGKKAYDEGLMFVIICDIEDFLKTYEYIEFLSSMSKAEIIINTYKTCAGLKEVTSELIRTLAGKDLELKKEKYNNKKE
jgi:hypothetical protein